MPSFLIYTLGCKLNQLESEAIDEQLTKNLNLRFIEQRAEDEEQLIESGLTDSPSIIIINTCTVTSKADQKARRVIRKALRDYPEAVVIVTGCYAQLNKDDILKLSGDDKRQRLFVINKENVLDFISSYNDLQSPVPSPRLPIPDSRPSAPDSQFQFNPQRFSSHTRSFLKIQDGCDRRCTYCRVSLARGRSRSLDAEEVLSELRALEERGFNEAVLTGVNITQYRDADIDLAGLLERLLKGSGKIRIRLSSIDPDALNDRFFEVVRDKRIRPHFHLSLQSGSAVILAKMGRGYTPAEVEKTVERLRSVKEDPFLACDIITAFPGETEAEFKETGILCERLGFSWIHAFPFSPRPGTAACDFPGKAPEREAKRRTEILTGLGRKGRLAYLNRWKGRAVEAVIEAAGAGIKPAGAMPAVSENYLKLLIRPAGESASAGITPGGLVSCRITDEVPENPHFDALAELIGQN